MESSVAGVGSAADFGDSSGYAVQVAFQRPDKSSRLLLLFRGFLVIPHLVYALVIGVVAAVLVLLNYLIVLITGRAAFGAFLSGALRYITRLTAYMYFLTDTYPPFSMGDVPDYPVQVTVQKPGKIHRWRIFSYLLAFPHIIVLYVLLILAALATFLAWFVVLFTGRYPAGLYGLVTSAIRYQARVNAYLYLIVSDYPPFSSS